MRWIGYATGLVVTALLLLLLGLTGQDVMWLDALLGGLLATAIVGTVVWLLA